MTSPQDIEDRLYQAEPTEKGWYHIRNSADHLLFSLSESTWSGKFEWHVYTSDGAVTLCNWSYVSQGGEVEKVNMNKNPWGNMDLDQYQAMALTTAVYPERNTGSVNAILYCAMGLVGEAGEVANQVKKILRDDASVLNPERIHKIIDEIGDCLWYIALLSLECNARLSDVGDLNVRKLKDRMEHNMIHGDARTGEGQT
jgi:NTP pyrophosphatase (non-canonical NTP hydrolase)